MLKPLLPWLSQAEYDQMAGGERLLMWAASQKGVREKPRNAGAKVAMFLKAVGLGVGFAWCASFIYWCAIQAGILPALLPAKRKAAAVAEWKAWAKREDRLYRDAKLVKRGDLFLYPNGHSHMGVVAEVVHKEFDQSKIRTYEGNTNDSGSREGDGVYEKWRSVDGAMLFIDMEGL